MSWLGRLMKGATPAPNEEDQMKVNVRFPDGVKSVPGQKASKPPIAGMDDFGLIEPKPQTGWTFTAIPGVEGYDYVAHQPPVRHDIAEPTK